MIDSNSNLGNGFGSGKIVFDSNNNGEKMDRAKIGILNKGNAVQRTVLKGEFALKNCLIETIIAQL